MRRARARVDRMLDWHGSHAVRDRTVAALALHDRRGAGRAVLPRGSPSGPRPRSRRRTRSAARRTAARPGAMITERREVELDERRGPHPRRRRRRSIRRRCSSATSPSPAAAITEQRFVPGATTPTELLARHVGDAITLVTPKGEVTGVLRSVDEQALVVELGAGDQRRLSVMRRDYVQDIRVPAGGTDQPSLVWRLAAKKPGKHTVELTYRADGPVVVGRLPRGPRRRGPRDRFLGVGDDQERDRHDVRARGADARPRRRARAGPRHRRDRGRRAPERRLPARRGSRCRRPVQLGAGEAVQVELVPAHAAAKAQPVVTYEAMPDPSAGYQELPGADCTENSASTGGTSELAARGRRAVAARAPRRPRPAVPPPGRPARGAQRGPAPLEHRRRAHQARGRHRDHRRAQGGDAATSTSARSTIDEKVEVNVENKGKQADRGRRARVHRGGGRCGGSRPRTRKGTRTGPQTQEYRVRVPANGSQTVTYTVVYSW